MSLVVNPDHGTTPASRWGRNVWPKCKCGFDPRDNAVLTQHYADHGFGEVDQNGMTIQYRIVRYQAEHKRLTITVEKIDPLSQARCSGIHHAREACPKHQATEYAALDAAHRSKEYRR